VGFVTVKKTSEEGEGSPEVGLQEVEFTQDKSGKKKGGGGGGGGKRRTRRTGGRGSGKNHASLCPKLIRASEGGKRKKKPGKGKAAAKKRIARACKNRPHEGRKKKDGGKKSTRSAKRPERKDAT